MSVFLLYLLLLALLLTLLIGVLFYGLPKGRVLHRRARRDKRGRWWVEEEAPWYFQMFGKDWVVVRHLHRIFTNGADEVLLPYATRTEAERAILLGRRL